MAVSVDQPTKFQHFMFSIAGRLMPPDAGIKTAACMADSHLDIRSRCTLKRGQLMLCVWIQTDHRLPRTRSKPTVDKTALGDRD